jgi:hypothetical protein
MEVVAASEHAVAIEVHPDLASGSAPRADRAQVRERRKVCGADGAHDQAFVVSNSTSKVAPIW